ncbi:MAG: AAA family ATPase [Acidobacteria bacterium]|nr:AAA family ATPase [Acidobacteriota bacterium]
MSNKPIRYRNGLIVGKFSPLHKGHESLIRFGLSKCDQLYVFAYSNPESKGHSSQERQKWLSELFPEIKSASISAEMASTALGLSMPLNDADDVVHRRFVGDLWRKLVGLPLDVVFTSEAYGDGFADELSEYLKSMQGQGEVSHEMMDLERKHIPISGTILRQDIHENRKFLSPIVYASFVHRICLLGAESTGKSTLAERLGEEFETVFVPEYGRELWESQGGHLSYEDMLKIAKTHISNEERIIIGANKFLFVDTSPLTTFLYSKNMFDTVDVELKSLANRNYDLTFLCMPDFPFVQDGTRTNKEFQNLQHQQYLRELSERDIPFTALTGSIRERVDAVKMKLSEYK